LKSLAGELTGDLLWLLQNFWLKTF